MKKYFIVSLVKNGILGGGIVADSEAITYRTGKVTIPHQEWYFSGQHSHLYQL